MVTFPLDTFFRTSDAGQEAHSVLDDDAKKVIILVGSGGNGKSQLCEQISVAHPGKFSVYHGDTTNALPDQVAADIAAGRRALLCGNSVPTLEGVDAHVIPMNTRHPHEQTIKDT